VLPDDPPLRSYHLPGEPLYLAAGLRLRAPSIFRYWHVPVVVLLVVAVAAVAGALFGAVAGFVAGAVAMLDPFTVAHGPVYDDAFLGAALFWTVAAIAVHGWMADAPRNVAGESRMTPWQSIAVVAAAGWAAITRTELMVALAAFALTVVVLPALRRCRTLGLLVGLGVVLSVGAWTARNAVVQHHVLVGSSHDGLTLWESTSPVASDALASGQVDGLSRDPAVIAPLWREAAEANEVSANAIFWRAALHNITAQPVRVAGLGIRKIVISLAGVRPELPLTAFRNLISIAASILLGVLAVLGWRTATGVRRVEWRAPAIVAALFGVEMILALALGPVGLRYWLAWRPVLWILAAFWLTSRWVGRPVVVATGAAFIPPVST
jgi:hypothetical protein